MRISLVEQKKEKEDSKNFYFNTNLERNLVDDAATVMKGTDDFGSTFHC